MGSCLHGDDGKGGGKNLGAAVGAVAYNLLRGGGGKGDLPVSPIANP